MGRAELANELWQQLLNQNPSNDDLCYVLGLDFFFREKAASLLISRQPNNRQLRCIIENAGSFLAEQAGQMLFHQNPDQEDLCCIIKNINSLSKQAKDLLKMNKDEILKRMAHL